MREKDLEPHPTPFDDGSLSGKRLVTGVRYPNHHPLTKDEIVALLRTLQEIASSDPEKGIQLSHKVQERLTQGIKGIVVPYPAFGPMQRRQAQLDELCVDWFSAGYDEGEIDELADRLYGLMQTSCGELLGFRIDALRERIKRLLSSRD